jgi:hypothetical protein
MFDQARVSERLLTQLAKLVSTNWTGS